MIYRPILKCISNYKVSLLFLVILLFFVQKPKAQDTPISNFKIGDKTFLLNGKPFLIKAAELHYTRIPRAYWEHRIAMCKALGMNTICLYAFWNIHEQKPGQFNFTGQNDIAEFCRLAQKQGMYVILRPGPYVCAEWEMGGLPWWLLKKKDIKLRSKDSYFLARTQLFLNKIGEQLADLQISRGGNILLVQVENEYGSYNTDKAYIATIRDMVLKAGFVDVPLFQCDWSSNFKNNALDGLLWTVNFGTGANIKDQFAELRKVAPTQPLMCSEFWSGWFDNWGRKHETREAKHMIKGIEEMLDNHISFSLYMTHGGTTFGHWGGANSPAYSPMCSSYDYDAPISEAGWVTTKYDELRSLMTKYADDTVRGLPPIPDKIPTIQIPAFKLSQKAELFDNLPPAKASPDIQPMEAFDQGWGTILYRTTLPIITTETSILISEVHDWAQVYIDGKLIGTMDRRKGENTLKMPIIKHKARLDILVEAMGRVNFGEAIHDRKGITEKVELVTSSGRQLLKNWKVFSFPPSYEFVKAKHYLSKAKTSPNKAAAYYKGSFELNEVGDVFLDMQNWGKGMVWVNGHSMGRFWEIGPQQTLYMPGCWLKIGKNEIIVLDLKGPKTPTIKGLDYPILDQLNNPEQNSHSRTKERIDLTAEKPIYQGLVTSGNGWKKNSFPKGIKARYVCIEITAGLKENSPLSLAELKLFDEDDRDISRENWKIIYADSEELKNGNHGADKILDLQESTFWQTEQKSTYPHYLIIDLGSIKSVSGIRLLPRMEEGTPGWLKDFNIYIQTQKPFKFIRKE